MAWGISAMLWTARIFSDLPGATGNFEAMPAAAFGAIVLGGLWVLLWRQRWRWLGLAPIAAGIVLAVMATPPDVMIAADGKLVAVRRDNGDIALSNRRHNRFAQSVWVRRNGGGEITTRTGDRAVPRLVADKAGQAECRTGVCRFTVAGRKAAIIENAAGLEAGCVGAELVISPIAAHGRCDAALVIDQNDLARDGATALRFKDGEARIETVRGSVGTRPWTVGGTVSNED